MALLALPSESIIRILALTEPLDILRCGVVCRLLRQIIESSAELQYLIELGSFGYIPPVNPRLDLSYKDKISTLRQHQDKWGSDTHMKVDTYKLRDLEARSMTYDFHGGTYVRGSSLPGMGECTRRLDVYQLPSINKGTKWKEWSHPDLGVDVRDFALQTDYDLLVLLEANEPVSDGEILGRTGASPDATQHIKIHLRSLETGQSHPVAVVGRYLAVFFQVLAWRGTRCYELRIWDWTTGKLISYIEPSIDGAESFTFLSDRLILVPCAVTFTSDGKLRHQAHLDIYQFEEPSSDDATAQPACLIASFCLPGATETQTIISRFSCRCDPAPSPSTQITVPYVGHPRIYDLASEDRILCIAIEALNFRANNGGRSRTKSMLYIPCMGLLSAVKGSLDEYTQRGSAVAILWKDWADIASWIDVGQIYTGNQCYVYGQRTVGLVYARSEDVANDAEEETTRIHSLVIFDFDPIRVKRASQRTRPGVRISKPETENAWNIPMEETKLMRDVFLGGESKANTPFSVRTTLINERFHSPYCYVMIDEEHVVIVLQDLGGRESSLVVYTFN
ncbi:unnamed protein product [Rhizoctonia solani]|uniref:F-box domain-containing protein n=1 Tax=Rhizoctonia solani TaxID=456999 RepID=A0A8H3HT52_9AGAM|nr:unnamed protein product [Rhizoctonia solani]